MKHLIPQLLKFFDDFSKTIREMNLEEADCNGCGICCKTPVMMTTSDLEHMLIKQYLSDNNLDHDVYFQAIYNNIPDEREKYPEWTCPFYISKKGCSVYPVRPFACRIPGPLSQNPVIHDQCAYKTPRVYKIPPEIPLWRDYAAILRQYDFKRGYIYTKEQMNSNRNLRSSNT